LGSSVEKGDRGQRFQDHHEQEVILDRLGNWYERRIEHSDLVVRGLVRLLESHLHRLEKI
jgi:hypothetical protein